MRGGKTFFKKHQAVTVFLILLVICLMTLSASTKQEWFRFSQWGFQAVSVVQRGFAVVETFFSDTLTSISQLGRLREAYSEVQKQLENYETLGQDIKKLELENQRLRKELEFSDSLKIPLIPAEVIAKDPANGFNAIIINKGSSHGIEKDMPVVGLSKGLQGLVGLILEVGPLSSKVRPLYDETSYVAAKLQTSRYEGLIRGGGGESLTLYMNYVKKQVRQTIQYGDMVVTSGLNSLYPRDIYIGTLQAINDKDWETSLELELEPIIEFSRLEYVYILKEGKDNG